MNDDYLDCKKVICKNATLCACPNRRYPRTWQTQRGEYLRHRAMPPNDRCRGFKWWDELRMIYARDANFQPPVTSTFLRPDTVPFEFTRFSSHISSAQVGRITARASVVSSTLVTASGQCIAQRHKSRETRSAPTQSAGVGLLRTTRLGRNRRRICIGGRRFCCRS